MARQLEDSIKHIKRWCEDWRDCTLGDEKVRDIARAVIKMCEVALKDKEL